MRTDRLLLVGAGGHAKVLYDALKGMPVVPFIDVRDDDESLDGKLFVDQRITAPVGDLAGLPRFAHVAIGNNRHRSAWCEKLRRHQKELYTVVHRDATVSQRAKIGDGSFVAARSVIGPDAVLEFGCIVNHGAIVDHDCTVGAASHIAPNAVLGGGVRVGVGVLVGAGAVVLPQVSIGDWAVIAAGAVVIADVNPGATIAGVPARNILSNESPPRIPRT